MEVKTLIMVLPSLIEINEACNFGSWRHGFARGWLRSVDDVMFSIPNMNATPRSNLDVLNQHRNRLKTRWQSIWYLIIAVCVLVLYFTRSFLVTSSLCSLTLPSEFSVVRKFKSFSEPRIGNMFPRMVRYVSIRDDDNEILVIKQHAYDNTQTLEGGYVRDFDAVRFYIRAQTQSNDSKTIQTPGTTTPSQTILSQKEILH